MANNIFQSWILHHLWISLLCSRQALSLNEIIKLKFLFVKGLISTFVDNNSVRCLCCRICEKVLVLWKNTPSTIARSQIDIFHTQMDWSFLRLTLQNYLQLQCFPVHISYFVAKLHVFLGYRSCEKGNFTRRIVKILPHIFPPENDDCSNSNRLYARVFGYNQSLLTPQERTMVITPWDPNITPLDAGTIGEIRLKSCLSQRPRRHFWKLCAFARFFAETS